MPAVLQIGQVARRTGFSVDAIRFYEKCGLLPRPQRSPGGFRLYPSTSVAELLFVRRAHALGFSLNEIRDLLALRNRRRSACASVRARLQRKIAGLRAKRAELERMEAELRTVLRECDRELRIRGRRRARCPVLAPAKNNGRRKHED